MRLTQLLAMYFDRSNAFETLWSFYLTVILGLLAFSGGGKQTIIAVAIFLTIGFLVFAVASFKALTVVTHQRCQLQKLIAAAAKADDEKAIAATIDSSTVVRVVAFHLLGDVLAIAGIWCFALKPSGEYRDSTLQKQFFLGKPKGQESSLAQQRLTAVEREGIFGKRGTQPGPVLKTTLSRARITSPSI